MFIAVRFDYLKCSARVSLKYETVSFGHRKCVARMTLKHIYVLADPSFASDSGVSGDPSPQGSGDSSVVKAPDS